MLGRLKRIHGFPVQLAYSSSEISRKPNFQIFFKLFLYIRWILLFLWSLITNTSISCLSGLKFFEVLEILSFRVFCINRKLGNSESSASKAFKNAKKYYKIVILCILIFQNEMKIQITIKIKAYKRSITASKINFK